LVEGRVEEEDRKVPRAGFAAAQDDIKFELRQILRPGFSFYQKPAARS
jgi:hypothetical protein